MNVFGEKIRNIRESKGLLLRQIAAYLEIDTALISKVERGERRLTREQVIKLSSFFNVSEEELITLWLTEKIISVIVNEPFAIQGIEKANEILKKYFYENKKILHQV